MIMAPMTGAGEGKGNIPRLLTVTGNTRRATAGLTVRQGSPVIQQGIFVSTRYTKRGERIYEITRSRAGAPSLFKKKSKPKKTLHPVTHNLKTGDSHIFHLFLNGELSGQPDKKGDAIL
jgi:hypothetical protein